MNIERLKKLRRALLDHQDNGLRFNMRYWWDASAKEEDWCGTTCCAFGLATTIPDFKKDGLHRSESGNFVIYKGRYGFEAAEAFFGLSLHQSRYLFMNYSYKKKDKTKASTVARRITKLISTNGICADSKHCYL